MPDNILVGVNDDYAMIQVKDTTLYYGYEEVDYEGRWMFTCERKGRRTIRLHQEDIGATHEDAVSKNLMLGIANLISRRIPLY